MREYASGEIVFGKPINFDPIIGEIDTEQSFFLDFNEYFEDEIEDLVKQITDYCKLHDVKATGNISISENGNGDVGEYEWNDSAEYEEFWNDYYHLKYMTDEQLIEEITKRGYTVSNN